MSLLEALLLDPQRINTWLALRNDEVLGSGTQTDPYNASPRLDVKVSINLGSGLTNVGTEATANATNSYADGDIVVISGAADPAFNGIFVIYGRTTTLFKYRMDTTPAVTGGMLASAQKALELRFDTVMSTLVAINTCVHLGPGVMATRGYYTGSAAWQAQSGMRIVGSGMGVTTLKLVNGAASKQIYVVGHVLSAATVDAFEICDLSINCHLGGVGASSSAGAIRIMGSNSRAVRVRVVHWGNKNPSAVSYVIAMLTGDGTLTPTIANSGIQECVATTPGVGHAGIVAVLHSGYTESPSLTTPNLGTSMYIRDCFVDCGQTTLSNTDSTKIFRGLSMSWCKGGVVEGNTVQNTFHGGPYNTLGTGDLTVRNNVFFNVAVGPLYAITTSGSFRVRIEGNRIELTKVSVNPIINSVNPIVSNTSYWSYGVLLFNGDGASTFPYSDVVVSNNYVGYVSVGSIGANPASGVLVYGATNLVTRDNILDLNSPPGPMTLRNRYCTAVRYSENRTPSGVLNQGVRASSATAYDLVYTELATDADDALILSLLRR